MDDYLPARMVNEYTYCPRLFYYEHVEGVFAHNVETVEGEIRHSRVDGKADEFPPPELLFDQERKRVSRSVMLSSERHQIIAKMDLVELSDGKATPVDYKRGKPREAPDGSIGAWEADEMQMGVQAITLRENGYQCTEAVIYYATTRQRVVLPVTDDLIRRTELAIAGARSTKVMSHIPPPLVDSPKCPRCSLVNICLPDETRSCAESSVNGNGRLVQQTLFDIGPKPEFSQDSSPRPKPDQEIRRLVPARDDLRPLYLNTQGLSVGKSGEVLQVRDKKTLVQEVRMNEICQLNLMGNVQLTTQAIQALCEQEIPIAYFSWGGWFYGVTNGLGVKNIYLRREQFRWADIDSFCLRLSKAIVAGKIRNQRTLLQRNHIQPPARALAMMKLMAEQVDEAVSLDQLLGIEGNAARIYFENFSGMLKTSNQSANNNDDDELLSEVLPETTRETESNGAADKEWMTFHFQTRNRRPPRDPVNALLSLAYSLLAKDLTIVCHTVGFDPYLGYFHQPRHGRAALALDLMEPFRPLIADSTVITAINTRMVTEKHFIRTGNAVALTPDGRKAFFRAYEQRMDTLVTHPLFGYRVSYRRVLEIQARLLARLLTGELNSYTVFCTR